MQRSGQGMHDDTEKPIVPDVCRTTRESWSRKMEDECRLASSYAAGYLHLARLRAY